MAMEGGQEHKEKTSLSPLPLSPALPSPQTSLSPQTHRLPAVCSYTPSAPRVCPLPRKAGGARREAASSRGGHRTDILDQGLREGAAVGHLAFIDEILKETEDDIEDEDTLGDLDNLLMEDSDSSDDDITLVDIVVGNSLTWRVEGSQMVKLSMKRKGVRGEEGEGKKLKEGWEESNHSEDINVELNEFLDEKLTRLVDEEEEEKFLKTEEKIMEERVNEPLFDDQGYDDQQDVTRRPEFRAKTDRTKSATITERKASIKKSVVADATATYSSGEEEGECRLCCRADPPPSTWHLARRRPVRAEVVWAGCDCGAWYHLECTSLARVRRDFTCAALHRDCSQAGRRPD